MTTLWLIIHSTVRGYWHSVQVFANTNKAAKNSLVFNFIGKYMLLLHICLEAELMICRMYICFLSRYCQVAFHSACNSLYDHQQCVSSSYSPSLVAHAVTQGGVQGDLILVCLSIYLHRAHFYAIQFHEFGLKHRAMDPSPQSRYRRVPSSPQISWSASLYFTPPPFLSLGSHWSDLYPYSFTFSRLSSKQKHMVCSVLVLTPLT